MQRLSALFYDHGPRYPVIVCPSSGPLPAATWDAELAEALSAPEIRVSNYWYLGLSKVGCPSLTVFPKRTAPSTFIAPQQPTIPATLVKSRPLYITIQLCLNDLIVCKALLAGPCLHLCKPLSVEFLPAPDLSGMPLLIQ